jgi:predicted DNA-binding protein (UPF0251 family)
MGRPIKWRRIGYLPRILNFVPSEKYVKGHEECTLKLEELEAIRLKDLEGLEQEKCAIKMQISRPTFQRILNSARKKLADSLINGKGIRIEGGNFAVNICKLKCADCKKEWEENFDNLNNGLYVSYICPNCGSVNVACQEYNEENFCRRNCKRHRRGRGK